MLLSRVRCLTRRIIVASRSTAVTAWCLCRHYALVVRIFEGARLLVLASEVDCWRRSITKSGWAEQMCELHINPAHISQGSAFRADTMSGNVGDGRGALCYAVVRSLKLGFVARPVVGEGSQSEGRLYLRLNVELSPRERDFVLCGYDLWSWWLGRRWPNATNEVFCSDQERPASLQNFRCAANYLPQTKSSRAIKTGKSHVAKRLALTVAVTFGMTAES